MATNQLLQNPNQPTYVIIYAASAPNPAFFVVVDLTTMLPSPTQYITSATQWRTQAQAAQYLATNMTAIGAAEIRPTYHPPWYYATVLPIGGSNQD